ncbi:MAG: hypothetical protein ACJ72L_17485, partial [Marmoricola sp.]
MEHAWGWFALHSGQRMHLISLYFVVVALLMAGYGAALQVGSRPVGAGLCVAGLATSAAFWLIDIRTKTLIKAAEKPLAELQHRLGAASRVPALALVEAVEVAEPRWSSYSKVVATLISASVVLMVGGFIYSMIGVSKYYEKKAVLKDIYLSYFYGAKIGV